MAKTAETAATIEAPAVFEKTTVHVQRGQVSDEEHIIVGINGKTFLLPKGKDVTVPYEVKLEMHRAQRAEDEQISRQISMKIDK